MKKRKPIKPEVNFTELRPHSMGLVMKGIADTYSTHHQMLQELTQNSIDVGATSIEVFINEKLRTMYVSDNGAGATRNEFNEALQSILKSSKGKDKFGRFGRGTISPLTKCREFTFLSKGRRGPAHMWTFHCKEIIESQDIPKIPVLESSTGNSWWRTQVQMKGVFFADAVKHRINLAELKSVILSSFATKMRQLGTNVKIIYVDGAGKEHKETFSAKSYTGKPLPVWESDSSTPAGKVIVRLYTSDDSSPIPITIGQIGDPFRLEWKSFFQSVNAFSNRNKRVTFDGKDINALFRSGVLTGEIECENITIHPERSKFERDEALDYFVLILDDWFQKVGKKIHADAEIHSRSSLYQQLAKDAAQRIEKHPLVDSFLQSVKFGTVGKGHADTGAKTFGTVTATDAVKGQDKGKNSYNPKDPPQTRNDPEERVTRPGHVPILVAGNEGKERTTVRRDSRGLIIEVVPFSGLVGSSAPLFSVEMEMGKVLINQLAPDFNASADRGDKVLRRFIDMVIVAALQTAIDPNPDEAKQRLEQYVKYANQVFLAGDQRTI